MAASETRLSLIARMGRRQWYGPLATEEPVRPRQRCQVSTKQTAGTCNAALSAQPASDAFASSSREQGEMRLPGVQLAQASVGI